MRMRTITMGPRSLPLHIEGPGILVNIRQLTDCEGRPITRVDVSADGDRCLEPPAEQWWCADAGAILEPRGIGIRVVKGIPKPEGGRK